jgi:hypothetical protein
LAGGSGRAYGYGVFSSNSDHRSVGVDPLAELLDVSVGGAVGRGIVVIVEMGARVGASLGPGIGG